MTDECIFCQIVAGDMPSYTVYEDEQTLAFLDVNPVSEGHTLVVPKVHAAQITELDAEITGAVFQTAQKLAQRAETKLGAQGVNLLQSNGEAAGQEINHVHVHVIPRYPGDGFTFNFDNEELEEEQADKLLSQLRK